MVKSSEGAGQIERKPNQARSRLGPRAGSPGEEHYSQGMSAGSQLDSQLSPGSAYRQSHAESEGS